jgi:predicted dehydrogenase/nucleoside-diphosphate-sugar epimerase
MLITGATGFIGARLATHALRSGYQVRTLTRSDWSGLPAVPVQGRYLGSLPAPIPPQALAGADVVVHCAAYTGTHSPSAHAINVEGSTRLLQLARETGVETFVFLSSQSARPDAVSVYGRTKYEAEHALLAQNPGGRGLKVVILRPGLVTGPKAQGIRRGLFQRLRALVERLPVLPLVGGGTAVVQPIHVDDLCAAILRCDSDRARLDRAVLHLGLPGGVSLAEFLQAIALEVSGRRKLAVTIPIGPVETALRLAERWRIPLSVHRGNVEALKGMQRMESAPDLARLGLRPRPLEEIVRSEGEGVEERSRAEPGSKKLSERALRVLLVGAGRIGLVHAVTQSRLRGAVLAGLVDPRPKATEFLRGLGLQVPAYRSLDQALARARADAAVIATPAASHLPLTRACLERGLAVLVEKPLAVRPEQLGEYETLARRYPDSPVQVGYVLPRNPQMATYLERLRAGEFGRVRRFVGVTLLSFIHEARTRRWEVNPAQSGGGALINAGGHVLSLIRCAFGDPRDVQAQSLRLYSAAVEDSLVAELRYPGFTGWHYCSWSVNGYPRPVNQLNIWTDRGLLILTASVSVFSRKDAVVEVSHQLDFDVGFNLAADYAGAGFTSELTDLQQAARTGRAAPMDLQQGIGVERLLFRVYGAARAVNAFELPRQVRLADCGLPITRAPSPIPNPQSPIGNGPRLPEWDQAGTDRQPERFLDLRDLSVDCVRDYLGRAEECAWAQYQLSPSQLRELPRGLRGTAGTTGRLRITVPDFLRQSRLLAAGRYKELLKQLRARGIWHALRVASCRGLRERKLTFWVAALGLLGAGLGTVPRGFSGCLLVHGYLVDLTLSLRRPDLLDCMLAVCRSLRPRARVGFHTNMAREAQAVLPLLDTAVDEISVLSSPGALGLAETLAVLRPGQAKRLTAEVGPAPTVVHQLAARQPSAWAHGADAVLIGPGAVPALAAQHRAELGREWAKAFPGVPLPEGVLA